jgi:putative intracellular protease/amidase
MAQELNNRKVAILATDGFEQVELTSPKAALEKAGAQLHVIAPYGDSIQGWNHHDKGEKIPVVVLSELVQQGRRQRQKCLLARHPTDKIKPARPLERRYRIVCTLEAMQSRKYDEPWHQTIDTVPVV